MCTKRSILFDQRRGTDLPRIPPGDQGIAVGYFALFQPRKAVQAIMQETIFVNGMLIAALCKE
jgi:hypothetical protein